MSTPTPLENEIRSRLLADPAIGPRVLTRMSPLKLPENVTYPAISYARVSETTLHHLRGPSGRAMPSVSISVWAETYDEAMLIADAIKASLDGFNGVLATIRCVIKLANTDSEFDGTVSKYRITRDYAVNMAETMS